MLLTILTSILLVSTAHGETSSIIKTYCQKSAISDEDKKHLAMFDDRANLSINEYRAKMALACPPKNQKPNLAELLSALDKAQWAMRSKIENSEGEFRSWISKNIERIVPGLKCGLDEVENYNCSISKEFEDELAKAGTEDDRRFFSLSRQLIDLYNASHETSGGAHEGAVFIKCQKFGKFDWRQPFRVHKELTKIATNSYFKQNTPDTEGLLPTFGARICTCNEKSAAQKDLVSLIQFLKNEPQYLKQLQRAERVLLSIKNGEITVSSDLDAYCGGG